MDQIIDFFKGKRTYILAIITACLNLAVAAGWITPDNMTQINVILGSLMAIALRSGVKNDSI